MSAPKILCTCCLFKCSSFLTGYSRLCSSHFVWHYLSHDAALTTAKGQKIQFLSTHTHFIHFMLHLHTSLPYNLLPTLTSQVSQYVTGSGLFFPYFVSLYFLLFSCPSNELQGRYAALRKDRYCINKVLGGEKYFFLSYYIVSLNHKISILLLQKLMENSVLYQTKHLAAKDFIKQILKIITLLQSSALKAFSLTSLHKIMAWGMKEQSKFAKNDIFSGEKCDLCFLDILGISCLVFLYSFQTFKVQEIELGLKKIPQFSFKPTNSGNF